MNNPWGQPISYPGITPPNPGNNYVPTPQPFTPGTFLAPPTYVQPNSSDPAQIGVHAITNPPGYDNSTVQDNNTDFLTTVKNMVGGAFGAIGQALDAEKHYVVRPIYEGLLHPDQLIQATMDYARGADHDPRALFDQINEQFENNQDPGLAKFLGEIAFDPLTYLSSGVIKGIQYGGKLPMIGEIAGVADKGMAGAAIAKSLDPLYYGTRQWERGVDAAMSGVSNFASGAANNHIPLDAAKDVARGTLTRVLPDGLVEGILNAVPDEYTGVNIGPVADWVNKTYPQAGLPRVVKVPEFRSIQVSQSYSQAFEAAQQALDQNGINYGLGADSNTILRTLRNIYAKSPDTLTPQERWTQDIIKRPNPPSIPQIKALNKAVGGSISDPTTMHQLAINNTLEQYARGPTISGSPDGIDQGTAISSLAELFGVNPRDNPEAIGTFERFLSQRSDDAAQFIGSLKNQSVQDVIKSLAFRAADRTDRTFSTNIALQRMENTWFDQMLTGFDSRVYKPLWQGFINKYVYAPLNAFNVTSLGMQFMQPAEAYLRHVVEGGGERLPIDPQQFAAMTSGIQGVPPVLRQLKPAHYIAEVEPSIMAKIAGLNPLTAKAVDYSNAIEEWSRNFTYTTRMSYWWKTYQSNLMDAQNALGLPIRSDLQSYIKASAAPSVATSPELNGIEQSLVDDAFMTAYNNPGSADNIRTIKDSLQSGVVNRKDLAQVADHPEVMDMLHPGPRAQLRNALLNGDPTSTNLNNAADDAIKAQKKLLTTEPEAQAEAFKGTLASIQDTINSGMYSPADLRQAVNMVTAMQQHAVRIPDLINKNEWDELASVRATDGWRQSMHTHYQNQLKQTLDHINPILEQGYQSLINGAAKFNLVPEVTQITDLLRSNKDLLFQTLDDQAQMQKDFFDAKPNRKLDATWNDPLVGYYPKKGRIWDAYNVARDQTEASVQQAQIDLMDKIVQGQAAGIYPPPVSSISQAIGQAKSASVEVSPAEIVANPVAPIQFTPDDTQLNVLRSPKTKAGWAARTGDSEQMHYFKSYTVDAEGNSQPVMREDVVKAMTDQFGPNAEIHVFTPTEKWRGKEENWNFEGVSRNPNAAPIPDPETASFSNIIDTGLASGNTPEEIAHSINAAIASGSGSVGEESAVNPSSTNVESQILGSATNNTIDAGGAPTESNPNDTIDPNSFLGNRYSALDTFRQRLNDLIQERIGQPKMNDTAHQFLSDALDNMYREYNALPSDTQTIMRDAQKTAVERTNQMHDQAFTNYDARNNFDKLMLHFIPWWMHESRRWPWLTRTFIGKPTMLSMWQAYQDNTDQGYLPIKDTPVIGGMINLLPSGNSWQVNPFRLITPFNPIQPANQFRPAYFQGGLSGAFQNIDQTLSQLGFNLGEMFDIPEAFAEGQPGTLLPPPLRSAVNIARGSNVPGLSALAANIQNMLPDNYRDYYTRMILASQGFEPDKVYNGAMDGDPTDTATLDVAQQQSSLVSAVLAQSGVLRYRTPEWTQYQQARIQAIASMTGLSEFDQNVLKNQGISIQQIKSLSPLQRTELANMPGARDFNEISEPLLNPAARKMREMQNEFFKTVDDERDETNQQQLKDDQRLTNGLISGVEWRRRYQDRSQNVANLIDDLKKSPAYKNVPITSDEQALARQRFNLPPFVQSPEDILLSQYYAIKPREDPITGDMDFSQFFAERQALLDKYPDLQAVLNAKLAQSNTAQVADFKRASQVLRPYFSIPDQIAQQHPEIQGAVSQLKMLSNTDKIAADQFRSMHPELSMLNRMVRQTQEAARKQFPEIDAALVKFYGATPIEYQDIKKNGTS